MDLSFGLGEFFDPLGIVDFAKDQYNANRDYGHSREMMDSQNMFTQRMSSTAYQRATEDMQAAGLNPMLAYQQGGASTPGGSTPVFNRSSSPSGSTAVSALQQQNIRAQTDLTTAQAAEVRARTPGVEASSDRLIKELDAISPYIVMNTQNEAYLKAAATDIARWNLSYEEARLRISESLLRSNLSAENRLKVADALLKELDVKYYEPKLIAKALAGVVAGAFAAKSLFSPSAGYLRKVPAAGQSAVQSRRSEGYGGRSKGRPGGPLPRGVDFDEATRR